MTKTIKTSPTNTNLRHWEALGTTDPAHTKQFKRAGGFQGTAIKPIESVRRMTEHFGPCGIGWGMEKPEFQLVPIEGNGELMIFCTVGLWFCDEGKDTSLHVWGVGGDKVVSLVNVAPKGQRPEYRPRTSDEAFKSAYTDALSNAMKHIGVGADVHMGLFDDSKYVAEARREFSEKSSSPEVPPETPRSQLETPLQLRAYEEARKGSEALMAFWLALPTPQKRELCQRLGSPPSRCPQTLKNTAQQADEAANLGSLVRTQDSGPTFAELQTQYEGELAGLIGDSLTELSRQ